jgi:hypothetical protein
LTGAAAAPWSEFEEALAREIPFRTAGELTWPLFAGRNDPDPSTSLRLSIGSDILP